MCLELDRFSFRRFLSYTSTVANSKMAPRNGATYCLLYILGVVLATILYLVDLLLLVLLIAWLSLLLWCWAWSLITMTALEYSDSNSEVFWSLWVLIPFSFSKVSSLYFMVGVNDCLFISSAMFGLVKKWVCFGIMVGWLDFFLSKTD